MKMAVARTLIRTKDAVEKETIAMVHSGNIKKRTLPRAVEKYVTWYRKDQ